MRLNPYIRDIQFPPISRVRTWLAGYKSPAERPLIDCCQAVPDYAPEPGLVTYLQEQLNELETSRYTPDEGLPEVRQSVSKWYVQRYSAGPDPQEICLSIGASQAFWLAITVLCSAGDEVILPAPAYFDHPMALQAMGINPVWIPFSEQNAGLPEVNQFAEKISPRTKAILLVSPNNPTGVVIPSSMLSDLFELAEANNLALIIDETYQAFLPDGKTPHTLFTRRDWQNTFIHLASFGKTFALTGYRAGALVAGSEIICQVLKIQDTQAVCQPTITQYAVGYGCANLNDWVKEKAQMMQRRQDLFCRLFNQSANPFRMISSGSFFAWIRHPWAGEKSWTAAKRLADKANLACLPGAAFGPGLEPYLRLAFGNLPEKLIPEAIKRFDLEI